MFPLCNPNIDKFAVLDWLNLNYLLIYSFSNAELTKESKFGLRFETSGQYLAQIAEFLMTRSEIYSGFKFFVGHDFDS